MRFACLLDGVLSTLEDDIRKLRAMLAQPNYADPNAIIPASCKNNLSKPPLAAIWNTLGLFSSDIVTNYMNLDTGVEAFRANQILGAAWHIQELGRFAVIVSALRRMIGEQSKLAHDNIPTTEP